MDQLEGAAHPPAAVVRENAMLPWRRRPTGWRAEIMLQQTLCWTTTAAFWRLCLRWPTWLPSRRTH